MNKNIIVYRNDGITLFDAADGSYDGKYCYGRVLSAVEKKEEFIRRYRRLQELGYIPSDCNSIKGLLSGGWFFPADPDTPSHPKSTTACHEQWCMANCAVCQFGEGQYIAARRGSDA